MKQRPSINVIQGYFRTAASASATGAHHAARLLTYQEMTLQAHQRSSGLGLQFAGDRHAFAVPAHLATFGRRTGQKLPVAVQQKMESFFCADFSDVQVHSGPEAGSIGALAFTAGSNIFFAPGQYNPNSHFGQQLLAHELTHVVQQRAGRVRNPFGSGMAVVQDPMLEAEAERMGKQAAMHSGIAQGGMSSQFPAGALRTRATIQRASKDTTIAQGDGAVKQAGDMISAQVTSCGFVLGFGSKGIAVYHWPFMTNSPEYQSKFEEYVGQVGKLSKIEIYTAPIAESSKEAYKATTKAIYKKHNVPTVYYIYGSGTKVQYMILSLKANSAHAFDTTTEFLKLPQ